MHNPYDPCSYPTIPYPYPLVPCRLLSLFPCKPAATKSISEVDVIIQKQRYLRKPSCGSVGETPQPLSSTSAPPTPPPSGHTHNEAPITVTDRTRLTLKFLNGHCPQTDPFDLKETHREFGTVTIVSSTIELGCVHGMACHLRSGTTSWLWQLGT